MKRRSSTPQVPRRYASTDAGRGLDPLAREVLTCCARIVARCGYSPAEAGKFFQAACQHIPRSVIGQGSGTHDRVDLAAHVLTLWRQEHGYVLANGEPRPLPWRGKGHCIANLVARVGRGLTLASARAYLLSTRSLRKVGRRYVPRSLEVAHPSNSRSQQAHHMRVFADMARTLEHNTQVRRDEERWFQYSADNPCIPVRLLPAFASRLRRAGRAILADQDAAMYRLAKRGRRGEHSKAVAVGIYLSLSAAGSPQDSKPREVKRSRPGAKKRR